MPSFLKKTLGFAFYGYAVFQILAFRVPAGVPVHPALMNSLFTGSGQAHIRPGAEFEAFRKYLPRRGTVSFLMDEPLDSQKLSTETWLSAQAFLAPLVLNPEPGEDAAILYCTSHAIADARMAQSGYRLAAVIADGKGMAVKK